MDTKFCKKFLKTLRSGGLKTIKIPPRSPNMNAHCERFIGSIKRECLDRFLVFGENHLRHILTEYLDYYDYLRPHRGSVGPTAGGVRPFTLWKISQSGSGRTLLPAVAHGSFRRTSTKRHGRKSRRLSLASSSDTSSLEAF